MRRADRLFQIVQLLRGRGVRTAAEIARELEVSPRTVYRDIGDLAASGVPIEGEAGVGYQLARGFDLPPLMFDRDEIGALVLGARLVQACADDELSRRARSSLAKIEAVVPERLRRSFERAELFVPMRMGPEVKRSVEQLRKTIDGRRKLHFQYRDEKGADTERTVRPLCLAFWGAVWTAGAWCELRSDFRDFRPDRMRAVELLSERFDDERGRDLSAYLGRVRDELARSRCAERRESDREGGAPGTLSR